MSGIFRTLSEQHGKAPSGPELETYEPIAKSANRVEVSPSSWYRPACGSFWDPIDRTQPVAAAPRPKSSQVSLIRAMPKGNDG